VDVTEVAIVGAGFGGLGAAIRLMQAGFDDLVVLERSADVGGTWHANSYPGSQCDIPSNLYSFSFAPKHDWTHSYPEQPQIQRYLRDCARDFGVEPRLRLGCELLGATWDEGAARWELETSDGPLAARVLVTATGLLSEPYTPPLPGLDRFRGPAFHSARWDHDADLRGKRVGLIGTGASAIQIGPRIEPLVGKLTVFQRTPPWVIPHLDRPIGPRLKRAYSSLPALQRLARGTVYALHELVAPAMTWAPALLKGHELLARGQLRRQVRDPELRERLRPTYTIGCKRLLLSNAWYPIFERPGVELVTAGIREVREGSIVTAGGAEHELDAIVLATGFTPADPPIARRLRGRDGRLLSDAWRGSPQAYLGTSVAGFPNLFLLYGPNLNLGHSSIVYMLESQIRYLVDAMREIRARGLATVEVRAEAQAEWNREVQRRLARSVWNNGGCASWYLDRNGVNSIQWPGFTFAYRRRVRRFDPAAYTTGPKPQITRG
jgi:cation diffusion facilitator CzcD-associated flavoprotein CzcO